MPVGHAVSPQTPLHTVLGSGHMHVPEEESTVKPFTHVNPQASAEVQTGTAFSGYVQVWP